MLSARLSSAPKSRAQINRAVAVQLLRQIDSPQQIQQYLHQFHPSQGDPLAVIALGREALPPSQSSAARVQLERLAESLAFLRRVGLFPIVVHGELDYDLELTSRSPAEVNVFGPPPADQSNKLRRIRTANYQVSALLERQDVETRPIPGGVFTAVSDPENQPSSAQGLVTAIAPEAIESAVRAGSIPIVAALGTSSAHSRTYALDPYHAAVHLARILQPLRTIFLRPEAQPPTTSSTTTLQALAQELGPDTSILLGTANSLSSSIFPDTTPWTVLRSPRTIQVVTSRADFPSQRALRAALQRHLHPGSGIEVSIDALLNQLDTRQFVAYFDQSPSEESTAEEAAIRNLAIVFPHASFPWPHTSDEITPEESISELALFGVGPSDWLNGVAEQFWDRIRADHVSLWGSLAEANPRLAWWLARSSGSLKRQLPGRVHLWYGMVA
ncbi:hypothetical protein ASPACDRAFT_55665 [Aspergillus aculeatus ATCC 16872]|uniref:N-acetyltransferase domain-containing protein n=1 Tax=Aspergillus aculeatus (strain ATCC 16872 / CBS 172.66 / WB 5094) TaxID=690307 RepID=A0A1L9WET6_ASPA1|nr:uncharacterized protein ASPACDRAFT_55665 [Aspergillus aculeatus ATCC 16872]OJJ94690.1 hypothetical protein ASPACDRAFT_55665 [Aspergillus aculeatus ATCC 16872]